MFQQAWAHEYAAEPLAMWCETNEKNKKGIRPEEQK